MNYRIIAYIIGWVLNVEAGFQRCPRFGGSNLWGKIPYLFFDYHCPVSSDRSSAGAPSPEKAAFLCA